MNHYKNLLFSLILPLVLPLSLGMQSQNVLGLQKILNQNPQTEIAATGPGSPGNETSYFGPLTGAAVKRFQQFYASDILTPAGLASPSGFIGPLTLAKLNAVGQTVSMAPVSIESSSTESDLLATYRVSTTPLPDIYSTDEKIQSIQDSITAIINTALAADTAPQINPANYQNTLTGAVIVTAISAHSGFAGAPISLSAQNLDPLNTIYFSKGSGPAVLFSIKNVSDSAGTLSFILPPFPPGRYDIAIQNSHGFSNTSFFVILSGKNPAVSIFSASPTAVRWGSTVTISGSGFTPTGNELVTTFDTIKNVASFDGKTLSFTVAPDQMKQEAAMGTGTMAIPDSIAVINDNGYSGSISFHDTHMKSFFIFFIALTVFLAPSLAYASILPYFGGLDTAVIPCNNGTWNLFIPLYRSLTPAPTIAGSPDIALPGPLVAPPTPVTFSNYIIHPAIWALGTQIPGAGVCIVGVCPACFSIPNYGLITPFTGTSLVPGPP